MRRVVDVNGFVGVHVGGNKLYVGQFTQTGKPLLNSCNVSDIDRTIGIDFAEFKWNEINVPFICIGFCVRAFISIDSNIWTVIKRIIINSGYAFRYKYTR